MTRRRGAAMAEPAKGGDIDIAAHLDKFGTRLVGPALFDNIYTRFSPRS
jgi:hypothetical protein